MLKRKCLENHVSKMLFYSYASLLLCNHAPHLPSFRVCNYKQFSCTPSTEHAMEAQSSIRIAYPAVLQTWPEFDLQGTQAPGPISYPVKTANYYGLCESFLSFDCMSAGSQARLRKCSEVASCSLLLTLSALEHSLDGMDQMSAALSSLGGHRAD